MHLSPLHAAGAALSHIGRPLVRRPLPVLLLAFAALRLAAQQTESYAPQFGGTLRAKYEYQPEMGAGRFEVRNARINARGQVHRSLSYKAEIDLSDEGQIKMLDAYVALHLDSLPQFTICQMRVPFTIDAHRSPHQQYFANRSFIAKQVGNVRDVGATLSYRFGGRLPLTLAGGVFNGSGLTNQKDYWTRSINYSVKAEWQLPAHFALTLSTQKARPEVVDIYMYDVGLHWHACGWHVEAEYLRKHYKHDAFKPVNAFDGFVAYDLPLRKVFSKMTFLGRFDYMSDHSDGKGADGRLSLTDAARKRLTGGITLSLAKAFVADIRLNYEKYFYDKGAPIKISEHDKIVVELMAHF